MPQQQNYDPMQEFWKRGFDFLFKQSPVIVLAVTGLWLLWQKLERLEVQRVADRIEVRKEYSEAITEVRAELRHCVAQKDTLIKLYTTQAVELAAVKAVQRRIERRIRTAPAFGVRE